MLLHEKLHDVVMYTWVSVALHSCTGLADVVWQTSACVARSLGKLGCTAVLYATVCKLFAGVLPDGFVTAQTGGSSEQ